MKIWVVVPVSRPEGLLLTVENFHRQAYGDKELVLVLNGAAAGLRPHADYGFYVLSSEAHQSMARNAALTWLRTIDSDAYVVFMDDDDYYGPEYLREHAELAQRGRLVGKQPYWVRFSDGHALFRREHAQRPVEWVRGGTLGGYAAEFPEFPLQPVGEDLAVCEKFRARGGEVWASGLGHSIYNRSRDDHTFRGTPQGIGFLWGPWCEWFGPEDVRHWVDSDTPPPLGEKRAFHQLLAR